MTPVTHRTTGNTSTTYGTQPPITVNSDETPPQAGWKSTPPKTFPSTPNLAQHTTHPSGTNRITASHPVNKRSKSRHTTDDPNCPRGTPPPAQHTTKHRHARHHPVPDTPTGTSYTHAAHGPPNANDTTTQLPHASICHKCINTNHLCPDCTRTKLRRQALRPRLHTQPTLSPHPATPTSTPNTVPTLHRRPSIGRPSPRPPSPTNHRMPINLHTTHRQLRPGSDTHQHTLARPPPRYLPSAHHSPPLQPRQPTLGTIPPSTA